MSKNLSLEKVSGIYGIAVSFENEKGERSREK